MSQINNKNQWNSLQIQSDIKTVIGELEARIELIEDAPNQTTISSYTRGKIDAYKQVVEMLEEVLEQ